MRFISNLKLMFIWREMFVFIGWYNWIEQRAGHPHLTDHHLGGEHCEAGYTGADHTGHTEHAPDSYQWKCANWSFTDFWMNIYSTVTIRLLDLDFDINWLIKICFHLNRWFSKKQNDKLNVLLWRNEFL